MGGTSFAEWLVYSRHPWLVHHNCPGVSNDSDESSFKNDTLSVLMKHDEGMSS